MMIKASPQTNKKVDRIGDNKRNKTAQERTATDTQNQSVFLEKQQQREYSSADNA